MLMIEAPKCEHDEPAYWVVDMLQRHDLSEAPHTPSVRRTGTAGTTGTWNEGRELRGGQSDKPVLRIEIQCPRCISEMLRERR